jgi:hypothetical protein
MRVPFWKEGGQLPLAGTGSVSCGQAREGERCEKMRARKEVKEDDPCTASGCQHAQSEFMCIASRRKRVNISVNIPSDIVLTVFIVSGK